MNIIFICSEYPLKGRPTGGFGRYVETIAEALADNRHRVSIICQNNQNLTLRKGKIVIYAIKSALALSANVPQWPQVKFIDRLTTFLTYPLGFSLAAANKLFKLQQLESFDIIEGGDFAAELFFYLLLRRQRLPKVIIKLHTPSRIIRIYNHERQNLFYKVMEYLEIFCLKKADAVYSPTKDLAHKINLTYGFNITDIIPYTLKIDTLYSKTKRVNDLILFVGKLQWKKGVFDLAQAVPKVLIKYPKAKFYYVGPDTLLQGHSIKLQLQQYFSKQNCLECVNFMGELNSENLAFLYKKATLLIIPSLWENFPNVLLEAGKYDLPVVATAVGGIKEIIESRKNGLLIKPQQPKELAKAIIYLLAHPGKRNIYASSLKKQLKTSLAPTKISELTTAFYEQILRG